MEEKMAGISIKTSITASGILEKLGVHKSLVGWLATSPCSMKVMADGLRFYFPGSTVQFNQVALTTGEVMALANGKLGITNMVMLREKTEDAIKQLQHFFHGQSDLKMAVEDVSGTMSASDFQKSPPSTLEKLQAGLKKAPIAPKLKPEMVTMQGAWAPVTKAELATMPAIKLRDAHRMYQPVHGTSSGARYFLVAGNEDLRVAARWINGTLSIRIEGPKLNVHSASVSNVFGGINSKQMYASVHLSVGNDVVMANKTLGAVLLGLGVPFDTPFPNAEVINGKGT